MEEALDASECIDSDSPEFIRDLRGRQPQALLAFIKGWERPVFNYATRIGLSVADAEDALQKTMIKFLDRLSGPEGSRLEDSRLRPWFGRVAYNALKDARRRRKAVSLDTAGERGVNDSGGVEVDFADAYDYLLDCLTDAERQLWFLRYDQEVSVADIADKLGVTSDAIFKRLERLRKKLRNAWSELFGPPPRAGG